MFAGCFFSVTSIAVCSFSIEGINNVVIVVFQKRKAGSKPRNKLWHENEI